MRRKRPRFLQRLQAGVKPGLATLVAAIGPSQYLFSGVHDALLFYEYSSIFCLGCGAVAALIAGRLKHLPDAFVPLEADEVYACRVATRETLPLSNEMTRRHFRDEFMSSEELESWRLRNPKAFLQVVNTGGDVCAGFGVVAFCKGFMDGFLAGDNTDLEIRPHEIVTLQDSPQSPTLYIAGVVVRDPESQVGRKRACVMVWCMLQYLAHIYGLRRSRLIYALAVTRESERLLKNLGFTLVSRASERRDGHNLYSLRLTSKVWHAIYARVGDYAVACKLPWRARRETRGATVTQVTAAAGCQRDQ